MFDVVRILERASGLVADARAAGFDVSDSHAAIVSIEAVECLRRQVGALAVELQAQLDRSQAFRSDGHASAKAMTRHVAKVSPGEAAGRARGARMNRDLPRVAAALADGALGVDQHRLLGLVHANPRVREAMVDAQDTFLSWSRRLSFTDFEAELREWERLADMDGPEPANSRHHETRNFTLHQDFDTTWKADGSFAALQGASIDDIYEHYVAAERLADWEKARAEHGDNATADQLPRTESQRRADAFWQVFQDAASADDSAVPPDFVHNIMWSADTYQQLLSRLDGGPAEPLDPQTYRCETSDGIKLEPVEAAANSLVHTVRRVVVDAAGTVIDLGRARRFTGSARTAARLSATHCRWPGCVVPASHCEIDHTIEHARGGRTDPGNGAPFCGRHNRHKQKGFTVWRDPTGHWHTYRPDGTELR